MTMSPDRRRRPKNLNLLQLSLNLPVPGVVSILHRASGVGLFAGLGLVLWALQASLGSAEEQAALQSVFGFALLGVPVLKLAGLGLLWAALHHVLAGLRYLLIDIHLGVELAPARASAKAVLAISLLLTVVIGGLSW